MGNQKPWGSDDLLGEDLQEQPEQARKPKYEVVRKFSFGKGRHQVKKVLPGDDLPNGISEKAIAHLLRKGVLKETL